MAKRQIFYSFHFSNDVMRVQQVRNMGVIEGNEPTSPNNWEEIKRKGDKSIEKWIENNMKNRSCVVVLIGSDTASRKWVKYEIEKAWNDGKGVVGIHIHNLKCPNNGTSTKGKNPFATFTLKDGKEKLSDTIKCYNPKSNDAYNDIKDNIDDWIEEAITIRNNYK
ncbi:MAG TPA: molecular chaperone Tir [Flavobacteriaceae bacterium]|nr:molecular chaperone Tir [Flavobacteriaceae bacterium]